jgi:iron complex transport system substrate-binding protein
MGLFSITSLRFIAFVLPLLLVACQQVTPSKPSGLTYGAVVYSKQFGFAETDQSQLLFFVNDKDTQWVEIEKSKLRNTKPRIVVLSTVFAGFINELNAQECIVGVDNINYYYDSVLHEQFGKNLITEVGDEGQINEPKLLACKPDYVISSGFNTLNKAFKERLKQQNIQLIICDNYKEQDPLARAEWIKLFGVLLNKQLQADSLFKIVSNNYLQIQAKVKSQNNQVEVMTDAMFSGVWNVPGGDSYSAKLIKDAGGNYVFSHLKPYFSYPLNLETVIKKAQNADIWIHVNVFNSLAEIQKSDSRYAFFKPFKTKQVYNYSKRIKQEGGNDYWEKGVVRPDYILSDLAQIFSNFKFSKDNLYFYTKLD